MIISTDMQKTIKKDIYMSGIGLFTGEKVSVKMKPACVDTGIVFHKVDVKGTPKIPATLDYVKKAPRCTIVGNKNVSILTVEHLLSSLKAYEIDNLVIEINGPEIPVGDGSAQLFVELIEEAGLEIQEKKKKIIKIGSPVFWTKGEVHIIAIPSDIFKISYLLHYPSSDFLKSQYFTSVINEENFKNQIAPARTFSVYEEIEPFLKKGLIKGGGLNNAVIIKDNKILNPEGVRFQNEMARHKVLDLMGDLSLIQAKLYAHVIAIRSGHFSNISFAKKIKKLSEVE